MDRLAEAAGISRTTLYHLERGDIAKPRASTLYKLAVALDVDSQDLVAATPLLSSQAVSPDGHQTDEQQSSRQIFDRRTNRHVEQAYDEHPETFQGWTNEQWDELYSTFGMGGALRGEGVITVAEKINRKQIIIQRLQVVLETHYGETAAGLIDNLYHLVQAEADVRMKQTDQTEQTEGR